MRNKRKAKAVASCQIKKSRKRHDRQVIGISDFIKADIAAIKRTKPPAAAKGFDHEVK